MPNKFQLADSQGRPLGEDADRPLKVEGSFEPPPPPEGGATEEQQQQQTELLNDIQAAIGTIADLKWDAIAADPTLRALTYAMADDLLNNPAPAAVTSPAPEAVTATIANGQSLSAAVEVRGALALVVTPSTWTAAAITFDASWDGGATFAPLYDRTGAEVTIPSASIPTNAIRAFAVGFDNFVGATHIKVRSGTAAAAVPQGAARSISLGLAG